MFVVIYWAIKMSGGPTGPALIFNLGSGFVHAAYTDGIMQPDLNSPINFELARAGSRKPISAEVPYESLAILTEPTRKCLSKLLSLTYPITDEARAPFFTLEFKLEIDPSKTVVVGKGYVQPYIPADRLDKGA